MELINGDCLNFLNKLPSDHVDLVITSPPYNMNLRVRKELETNKAAVQEIANHICSQPEKRIKRRLLLRRFNIKVEDLEAIQGLLPNFGINYKEKEGYRNKTTIYYSTMKSRRGIYWRVGV